ncbi:MAG: glycoside hydrolase family 13 protein [Candidatus Limnocylindrales bacterium]
MTGSDGSIPPPVSEPEWVRDAVFYQVFPDRFASSRRVAKPGDLEPWDAPPTQHGFKGGDLLGIAEHLDELHALGITALYLTPVFASASNHRYHTYDYERVDPLLGGDAALRELLVSAHARGMRVILDGVFNHASRGFWPFHHVLENGGSSPYRDWFYLDPDVLLSRRELIAYPGLTEVEAVRQMQSGLEPSVPVAAEGYAVPSAGIPSGRPGTPSQRVLGYQAWWDMPALPKLNHSNPQVREYIYGVAERWIRFGIDGWRLDVPEEIAEPGFWEEFRRRVLAANPQAYLVGEIWNPAPEWLAGDRFHALMNYPLTEAILSFAGAGRLDEALVAKTHEYARTVRSIDGPEFGRQLAGVMAMYPPEVTSLQLNLLDSHDTPRFVSLAGGDATALRLATLIQMTLPGAPCVYYGDEVGLEGGADPDCRRAYQWDPVRQDLGLRDFIGGLIALRHAHPVLRRGRFELLGAEGSAVAYGMFDRGSSSGRRRVDGGRSDVQLSASRSIIVAVNAGDTPVRFDLEIPELAGHRAEQVSWPGLEWRTTFLPMSPGTGVLPVQLASREGVVIEAAPDL